MQISLCFVVLIITKNVYQNISTCSADCRCFCLWVGGFLAPFTRKCLKPGDGLNEDALLCSICEWQITLLLWMTNHLQALASRLYRYSHCLLYVCVVETRQTPRWKTQNIFSVKLSQSVCMREWMTHLWNPTYTLLVPGWYIKCLYCFDADESADKLWRLCFMETTVVGGSVSHVI